MTTHSNQSTTTRTVDVDAEAETLKRLSREWSARIPSGDLDAIVAYWADDAVLMPPGLRVIEGKAAIRRHVESSAKLPGFKISWEPLSAHVARSGDLAYLIERNVTTFNDANGKPVTTHGKVVTVWRKDADGQWRNVVDIWNEVPGP